MSLWKRLFGGGKPSQPAPHAPTLSRQAASTSSSDDIQLTDRSWRTSVLLVMLLEAEGKSRDGLNLLLNKSFDWMRSSSSVHYRTLSQHGDISINSLNQTAFIVFLLDIV